MTQRSLVSSSMMQANVQNTWNANGYQMAGQALRHIGSEYAAYDKQQEEIAFHRLDLEAQKLQEEQLNNIRLTDNQDDIPLLSADFAKTLNEQFSQDKWGKRWLEKRGENFLAANELDVQRLSQKKQEELTILETNKTLKTFADEIAVSAPDKAQALINQANLMVETRQFLTPTQKQSTKDNFTKLWIDSMVTHNTEEAIRLLSDANKLENLTDIERKDYLSKANRLKLAKDNELAQKSDLMQKQQKLENAMKIAELKVGLITGRKSIEDIEQAKASGIFDLEPKDYLGSYQLLNKETSQVSNPETLADVKNRIINGTITQEDIIDLRLADLLNEADSKELMSLWDKKNQKKKTVDSTDEEFKVLAGKIDTGEIVNEEQLSVLYHDKKNPISRKSWNDALTYLEKKQKKIADNEKKINSANAEEHFSALTDMIERGEISDINDINLLFHNGKISRDVWQDASKYYNDFAAAQKKSDEEKLKIQKEDNKKEQLNNYLADISAVDNSSIDDYRIWQNIANGRYDESHGEKLIERYNKKMAAEGKLSTGQKANMALSLYSDLEKLYSSGASIDDYGRLNGKIVDYMNRGIISAEDGEKMLNAFTISHMNKFQSDLEKYGNNPWFGKDEGFFAIKDWADGILGKDISKPKPSASREKHREYQETMGARAAAKLEIYGIYADALNAVAVNSGLSSAADILSQNKTTQSQLYGAAVKLTQDTWAKNRYKTLNNNNLNPTAILSKKDGLINIGGQDKGGFLLGDERPVRIAHDPERGKYAVMFKDGTVKEVNYEVYKRYSGGF